MTTPTHAPGDQDRLQQLFDERSALVDEGLTADGEPEDAAVVVVVRDLDLTDLVRGAIRFADDLDEHEADAWFRSWTRTRFLFGNSANLTGRSAPRLVGPNGSMAWIGPFDHERPPGVARLLKPVSGTLPPLADAELPAATTRHTLDVARRGLSVPDYLVHVHHTIAEAVLLGDLDPSSTVRLRHRRDLGPRAVRPGEYARVHHDLDGAGLRMYTHLAGDRHGVHPTRRRPAAAVA